MALLKWFILMVAFTNRILSLKQVAGAKLTLHIFIINPTSEKVTS